ncbi:MAG: DUF2157 domain-containing protein [Leptospiraceae bacterium]|nr:DUF2157 domain-containing protein [Leptospiraceae bacterium]
MEASLITADQRDRILDFYRERDGLATRGSLILRSLAALLVSAAVFLVISQNWYQIPLTLRSLMVLIPLIISHALGFFYWLRGKQKHVEVSFFLASLLLGANIFGQAQLFHLISFYPYAFLAWMLGILPSLIWLRSKSIFYLYLVLHMVYTLTSTSHGKFDLLTFLLVLPAVHIYSLAPSRLGFWTLLTTFLVNIASFLTQKEGFSPLLVQLAVVLALYAIREILCRFAQDKVLMSDYLFFGYGMFLWYLLTFPNLADFLFTGKITLEIAIIILVSLAILLLHGASEPKKITLVIFLVSVIFLRMLKPSWQHLAVWILNLLFFLVALFFLYLGFRDRKKTLFFQGIALLLFLALGRYLSLVKDYVTTAALFTLSALLLWYLNKRWEKRYGEK